MLKKENKLLLKSKYHTENYGRIVILENILFTFIAVFFVFRFIFGIARVQGISMLPTYKNGENVLFYRLSGSYEVSDVIALKMPNGEKMIKRICACPGDTIDIHDGKLFVNGEELVVSSVREETQPVSGTVKMKYPIVLHESQYFVIGDNRANSTDSRSFGPIVTQQILGKLIIQH